MFHPEHPEQERIEGVMLHALRRILEHQDAASFIAWAREAIPDALALTEEGFAPEEARRLGVLLGTAIWNATPLPSRDFRTDPLPEPEPDAPCPCGSGLPYRSCCAQVGETPELPVDLVWEMLLDELSERDLLQALTGGAVPRHLLGLVAERWLVEDRPGRAVSLLEPLFAEDGEDLDERFEPALNVLCDAYDRLDHWKKKREFLERITERGTRALKAGAWQRLATIHIDDDDFDKAHQAFTQAMRQDPDGTGTALLEITLLAAQHKDEVARQRAVFWRRKLARRGIDDEGVMSFLARAAEDPQDALVASQAPLIDPLLLHLREWIRAMEQRPVPEYRIEACRGIDTDPAGQLSLFGDADAAGAPGPFALAQAARLLPPQPLRRLEGQWHGLFGAPKPHSTRLSPFQGVDPWDHDGWVHFLLRHPEAADSLDILDDLATALYMHPESSLPWIARSLLVPVLERGRHILERTLPPGTARTIPWAVEGNRPPLRLLFRLYLCRRDGGDERAAADTLEYLLSLNPNDNHGARAELMNHYLRRGEDDKALDLAGRFPDDVLADLAYGEVLALYRQGHQDDAARALSSAYGRMPRIPHYLTRKRIRPPAARAGTHGSDDQAWRYREAMRDVWEAEPGVLAWLKRMTA